MREASVKALWRFALLDGLVLARPDFPGLFVLNPTAALLWGQFDTKTDLSLAAQLLSDRFSIPVDQAERDALRTYQTFIDFVSAPPAHPISPPDLPTDTPFFSATYRISGVAFHVKLATEKMAEELVPRLADLRIPDIPPRHIFALGEEPGGVTLHRDGTHFATEPLLTGARAILLQEFTRLAAPGRNFAAILHAGACGNSSNCVILAGPSFSGKSTLCAGMMAAGLICYSDDSVCLTPEYQVAGMPFALALREGDRFRPSNLKGQSPTVFPAAIVFVKYEPQSFTVLEAIDAFEAFLELQKAGFWVEHNEAAISGFLHWLQATPRYRFKYSQLPEAITEITSLL